MESPIYPDQQVMAQKIATAFCNDNIYFASLIAPPQWGKTGVVVELVRLMTLATTKVHPDNVFIITGMSDIAWKEQTISRVIGDIKNRVFHRCNVETFVRDIHERRDCLIVLDECHIATNAKHHFSQAIISTGIIDPVVIQERNIRILQTSATPTHTLVDALAWGDIHRCFVAACSRDYVGFDTLLNEGRVMNTYDLTNDETVETLMQNILKTWDTPKYHIFRLNIRKANEEGETLMNACNTHDFHMHFHDSVRRIVNIDYLLSQKPEKHTVILIKGFWRAAKTFVDTHIGLCHESSGKNKDYNAEIQGLAGRLCGYGKQRGEGAPIICCKQWILEEYIAWFCKKCDYKNVRYVSTCLRFNRGHVVSHASVFHPRELAPPDEDIITTGVDVCLIKYRYYEYDMVEFFRMLGCDEFPSSANEIADLVYKRFNMKSNVENEDASDTYYCHFPRQDGAFDIACGKDRIIVAISFWDA